MLNDPLSRRPLDIQQAERVAEGGGRRLGEYRAQRANAVGEAGCRALYLSTASGLQMADLMHDGSLLCSEQQQEYAQAFQDIMHGSDHEIAARTLAQMSRRVTRRLCPTEEMPRLGGAASHQK